jgi:hypothetical protein
VLTFYYKLLIQIWDNCPDYNKIYIKNRIKDFKNWHCLKGSRLSLDTIKRCDLIGYKDSSSLYVYIGSDHCACLNGSDVTGSHVTFPLIFFPYPPVLFFPYLFPYYFPVFFFTYCFLSSSTKCWLGCSLWRPRPITFYELAFLLVIYHFPAICFS